MERCKISDLWNERDVMLHPTMLKNEKIKDIQNMRQRTEIFQPSKTILIGHIIEASLQSHETYTMIQNIIFTRILH